MERRLAAIFAADVVGYSRLMGADEVGTLLALSTHRTELFDVMIREHSGRIVKLTGDGMLVEFPSVVSAVDCAAGIQREMRLRNAGVPEGRRIEFRIGIHLGDVIVEDGDLFGDGVNIAARIESIARPGGVSVSASVQDHVGNKLNLTFEDMGEQVLKNIERPIRVYNVKLEFGSGEAGHRAAVNTSFRQSQYCCAAFRKHGWRPRTGLLCRGYRRGHPYGTLAFSGPLRYRSQLFLFIQR